MSIKKLITITIFCVLATSQVNAQDSTKFKEDLVSLILSDTFIGFDFYIPLKVKLDYIDTIMIYSTQTQLLYQYYKDKYGWNGRTFMREMKPYLIEGKVLKIDDDKLLYKDSYMSFARCAKLYNENEVKLKQRIQRIQEKKEVFPEYGCFACLIYKCFLKNMVIGYGEGEIWYTELPLNKPRKNEVEGSPLD